LSGLQHRPRHKRVFTGLADKNPGRHHRAVISTSTLIQYHQRSKNKEKRKEKRKKDQFIIADKRINLLGECDDSLAADQRRCQSKSDVARGV